MSAATVEEAGVNGWWVLGFVAVVAVVVGVVQLARSSGGSEVETARNLAVGLCGSDCFVHDVAKVAPGSYDVLVWRVSGTPTCYRTAPGTGSVHEVAAANCRAG